MYNFIDVTEVSEESILPSEALKLNGEYIENQISGYRTLSVQGREALSPDVISYTTGVRDGSKLKRKRYPERIIVVTYKITAESDEAFRDAYNKLGGILNVQDAELIFNDEQDKFYIGTPCTIGEVSPGKNAVVGKFEILCTDPFKYSVVEYEAEPNLVEGSVLIDYNGTYKSFPTLEADFYSETEVGDDGETAGTLTGSGDCGFVAFFNENEKIIQLGDPDEVDGQTLAKSQTLINQTFKGSTAWGTTAKKLWTVNNGKLISNTVQVGSVQMATDYETAANTASTTGTILTAKSKAGEVTFNYKVTAKASGRTEKTVKVDFAITASLAYASNYFGYGYGLKASVYVGGSWHNVTLKTTNARWSGNSGHTVNLSVTVSGLTATQSALTGLKFKVSRTDSYGTSGILGETACSNLAISAYATATGGYYLTAASYGTDSAHWHGPSITRQIGADAAGQVGAVNFTLTYKQKMCMGSSTSATKQKGGFQMQIADASGNHICGVRVYKNSTGKTGKLALYANSKLLSSMDIDLTYNNKYFGSGSKSVQTTTITKTGSTITFNVGGVVRKYTVSALASVVARRITFAFEQYPGADFLTYNGLYSAKFVKNNCDTFKDIPNKFSANDVVTADCKNGQIRLNGTLTPSLGALGNDWEGFYLTPGLNQIGITYSAWVTDAYAPTMKVRYREVFL